MAGTSRKDLAMAPPVFCNSKVASPWPRSDERSIWGILGNYRHIAQGQGSAGGLQNIGFVDK